MISAAAASDAPVIHRLMMEAFMEYKNESPPSSALAETVQSVSRSMADGEQALIAYEENQPVGMVRFQLKGEELYFYRLSVLPERQGKGTAKKILKSLEHYAAENNIRAVSCKVRRSAARNVQLYTSIGYQVHDKEVVRKPSGMEVEVVSMKRYFHKIGHLHCSSDL